MPTVGQAMSHQYADYVFNATKNGNYSVDVFVTHGGGSSNYVYFMAVCWNGETDKEGMI